MSSDVATPDEQRQDADSSDADPSNANLSDADREDLVAQVELLTEENRRLREEYVSARKRRNRLTAFGLLAVGILGIAGAVAFPDSQTVLFALGGTGLFGAVLTYYLMPEQFVAAETGERVYAAFAATGAELVAELGLQDDRVYVPAHTDEGFADVRLFVPQYAEYAVPDSDRLDSLFVVANRDRGRGVAVVPSGSSLFHEFETTMTGSVAEAPGSLADQLADALVEGFELADSATPDVDPENGRLTVAIAESAFGAIDRFDHPIPSFLGAGLSVGLGVPVSVDVTTTDGQADYFVTCTWDPSEIE